MPRIKAATGMKNAMSDATVAPTTRTGVSSSSVGMPVATMAIQAMPPRCSIRTSSVQGASSTRLSGTRYSPAQRTWPAASTAG